MHERRIAPVDPHPLWRSGGLRGWPDVGTAPSALAAAPASQQRRSRRHLPHLGSRVRCAARTRGHRRVGGIWNGRRNGGERGKRGSRDCLACPWTPGTRWAPAPGTRPILCTRGGRRGVAADGAGASGPAWVGPYRRRPGSPSGGRTPHGARAGAVCRRAGPGPEAGGRQEDALGGGRGAHTRRPVGCSAPWGGGDGRLHIPLRFRGTWAHRLMLALLAAVISLALFTVGVLEHPFSGGARVEPGAFELILDRDRKS